MKKKRITKKQIKKIERRALKKKDLEWAKAVKFRWANRCMVCWHMFGVINTKYLNSHHLVPREIKELRHDLRNGICVCVRHHKFDRFFSFHRNPLLMINWLLEYNSEDINYLLTRLTEIRKNYLNKSIEKLKILGLKNE